MRNEPSKMLNFTLAQMVRNLNRCGVEISAKAYRAARSHGVTRKQMFENLTESEMGYLEDLRKHWKERNDAERHRSTVMFYIRRDIKALRRCAAHCQYLYNVADDDPVCYLRWVVEGTPFPILVNPQGRAVARLTRGQLGRGFAYQIFKEPTSVLRGLYDSVNLDVTDSSILVWGEARTRKAVASLLIAEVQKRAWGVFRCDVHIPDIAWDGRWWRVVDAN